MPIGVRDVNRCLGQLLWPTLRARGFEDRTQRAAWRRREDGVDVVEIQSIGPSYDSVGCTSFSFTAYVAALIYWAVPPESQRDGKTGSRPHYWNCEPFVHQLNKTLHQPWFRPFTRPPEKLSEPMRLHQEALKRVFRTDVHDRPDVWFVLEDGTNLDQDLRDLAAVVREDGLAVLERFHNPEEVIQMATKGELRTAPESPASQRVVEAALARLGQRSGEASWLIPG